MSYLWSFQSYSQEKFSRAFGGGQLAIENQIVDAVMCHTDFWDIAIVQKVARHLVHTGMTEVGLATEEIKAFNDVLKSIFSPEGLETELEIEYESPDGVHPTIIAELLSHAKGRISLTALPWLSKGRRAGVVSAGTACEYCLLTPEEVVLLQHEVQQIVALSPRWSKEYVPQVVKNCLLNVLGNVSGKKKAVAALLG